MTMINEAEKPRRDPSSVKNWIYRRGDIYLVDFDPVVGSEQGGVRPGLVLQNDIGNFFSPTMVVAPVTTQLHKLNLPTHYLIRKEGGLYRDSMVELEQIRTIDKSRVEFYIGKLSPATMKKIDEVVAVSLELQIIEDVEAP